MSMICDSCEKVCYEGLLSVGDAGHYFCYKCYHKLQDAYKSEIFRMTHPEYKKETWKVKE